jgi:hypothetical protein
MDDMKNTLARLPVLIVLGALVPGPAASGEEKPAAKKEPAPGLLEILKIGEEKKAEAKEEAPPAAKDAPAKDEKDGAAVEGRKKKEDAARAAIDTIIREKPKRAKAPGEAEPAADAAPDAGPPADVKKDAPPPKKKAPQPPMFRLRDGTRLAGTPDLKLLHLATPYGRLEIPVNEIVQIRFAAFHDPELAARVTASVEALGSEEFDRREEAMAALRKIGAPAAEALKKALAADDEEVKTRAEKLLSEIEDDLSEADEEEGKQATLTGEDDEVVTLKFTAMGRVEEEAFNLETRYGTLKLGRKDIVSILFQDAPVSRTTVEVPGATFSAAGKWHDAKVDVTQGEMLRITATGSLNLQNYGQNTTPDGTRSVNGNQLEEFACGSLVAKVGEKGKAFLVGSDFQGSAPGTGKLFLGISIQNGEVSGSYKVEVELEGGN